MCVCVCSSPKAFWKNIAAFSLMNYSIQHWCQCHIRLHLSPLNCLFYRKKMCFFAKSISSGKTRRGWEILSIIIKQIFHLNMYGWLYTYNRICGEKFNTFLNEWFVWVKTVWNALYNYVCWLFIYFFCLMKMKSAIISFRLCNIHTHFTKFDFVRGEKLKENCGETTHQEWMKHKSVLELKSIASPRVRMCECVYVRVGCQDSIENLQKTKHTPTKYDDRVCLLRKQHTGMDCFRQPNV